MGRFIVFEGADNCGKSTLIGALRDCVAVRSSMRVETLGFPSGSPIGKLIRSALRGVVIIEEKALLHLFQADVLQLQSWIDRRLEEGFDLLCDRYTMSHHAYQREAHPIESIHMVENAVAFRQPDHTFVIDVPPEVAAERGARRDKYTDVVFEKNDDAYRRRIRARYAAMATTTYQTTVLDGTLPVDELVRQVMTRLEW